MAPTNTSPPVRRYNLRSHTPRHLQIFNPPLEPCGDFHLFARFPADIRWLVWQQALSHERWINISLDRFDYTDIALSEQMLTDPQEYNIVLDHRWRISKLFRTTSESRRAALAFYRVQLPCWHKRKRKIPQRGTLYVCLELDTLNLSSLEYFGRFSHDVWARDHRHIGLINLALSASHTFTDLRNLAINDESSLKQGISRIERLTLMSRGGIPKVWGGFHPSNHSTTRSYHTIPIYADTLSFNRLAYDPRLQGEDLRRVDMGVNPRSMFRLWFQLLVRLGVRHKHKVVYQFGNTRRRICPRSKEVPSAPPIHDRGSASAWVRADHEHLKRYFDRCNSLKGRKVDWDHEIAGILESSPQPAVGFWLFPMESVFTPADLNGIHTHTQGLDPDPKTVDMSNYMPELCLADIF